MTGRIRTTSTSVSSTASSTAWRSGTPASATPSSTNIAISASDASCSPNVRTVSACGRSRESPSTRPNRYTATKPLPCAREPTPKVMNAPARIARAGASASVGMRGPSRRRPIRPETSPTTLPITSSRPVVQAMEPASMSPLALPTALTSARVSAIATGSLKPASASSSRTTRAPPAPARETAAKTAAGSVGESTAPSRSASVQLEPGDLVRRDRDEGERRGSPRDPEREHGRDLAAHGRQPALETALQQHDDECDRAEDRDDVRPRGIVRAGPQLSQQRARRAGTRAASASRRRARPAPARAQRQPPRRRLRTAARGRGCSRG